MNTKIIPFRSKKQAYTPSKNIESITEDALSQKTLIENEHIRYLSEKLRNLEAGTSDLVNFLQSRHPNVLEEYQQLNEKKDD